ncbi:MAG: Gfo/Idh/MocA family protein [Bacteroidota bacterium]
MKKQDKADNSSKIGRRDLIKGLATVPVLGALAYGHFRREHYKSMLRENLRNAVNLSYELPPQPAPVNRDQLIRIGIIGFGIRGKQLLKAAGFLHPAAVDDLKKAAALNSEDKRYEEFLVQDDLNVRVTGVCDIFDTYGLMAQESAANLHRESLGGKIEKQPKRYRNYKELCAAPDIDAVIVATPDHWHAPMAMEAARNGKHVYCEKPMTWTVEETYEMREIIKQTGIVFQLGHQGRQTDSYIKAQEAVEKNVLGKITLVEVCTNRNDPNGAWVYPIHEDASPETIDWEQFIGPAPWHNFDLKRFFRWRCWWDYSTGLNGDLLTHEYDAVNQILKVGIPESAVSSGGIYFFKDGRTVPDVLQVAYEFPKHDMTMLYSATLASSRDRGKVMMGHDAHMELGHDLTIYADLQSTQYSEPIKKGVIKPELPIFRYVPGAKTVDAVTSATEQYFAGRGLLYTYRGGKRVDTTHLHVAEWLDCIRTNKQPSCDIDQGFEEAITAHMATMALREGRTVYWDAEKEKIV